MVNILGSPVLKSSNKISKFFAPTDSQQKFNEKEVES